MTVADWVVMERENRKLRAELDEARDRIRELEQQLACNQRPEDYVATGQPQRYPEDDPNFWR